MIRRVLLALGATLALAGCGFNEPRAIPELPVTSLPAPPAAPAAPTPASPPPAAPTPVSPPAAPAPRVELPPTARSLAAVRVSEHPCHRFVVGDASVYWWGPSSSHAGASSGSFHVVPKGGGAVADLDLPMLELGGFAIDREHVYWTATGPGRVRAARLGDQRWGGLAADQASPAEIAVDDTHVYWIDRGAGRSGRGAGQDDGALMRAPKGGGAATPIVTGLRDPAALALDETHVYWSEARGEGHELRRIAKSGSGGAPATVAPAQPVRLALDETHVYWTDHAAHALQRAPRSGGAPVTLYESPDYTPPEVLALDRTSVFFADYGGGIYRVPKAGGPRVLLTSIGGGGISALATDGSALWACAEHGLWQLPFASGTDRSTTLSGVGGRDVAGYQRDGRLVSTDATHLVTVQDTATGHAEKVLAQDGKREPFARALALSGDRRSIFVWERFEDRRRRPSFAVQRRDLETGAVRWTTKIDFDGYPVAAMSAPAADRLLLAIGHGNALPDGTVDHVVVLDAVSGRLLRELGATSVHALALLPDGRTVLTATRPEPYSYFYAWDLDTGAHTLAFDDPRRRAVAMAVSRDGRRAVTASQEGRIAVWDLGLRRLVSAFETHEKVHAVALLGAGERVLASTATQGCLWDAGRGERLSCSVDHDVRDDGPPVISPSEDEVAWPGRDFVRLWRP